MEHPHTIKREATAQAPLAVEPLTPIADGWLLARPKGETMPQRMPTTTELAALRVILRGRAIGEFAPDACLSEFTMQAAALEGRAA